MDCRDHQVSLRRGSAAMTGYLPQVAEQRRLSREMFIGEVSGFRCGFGVIEDFQNSFKDG